MAVSNKECRKYIIGWLTCKPGKRDEVMEIAIPYTEQCQKEDGCIFFEMNRSSKDSDIVQLTECFDSAEAHTNHLNTSTFQSFFKNLQALCVLGKIESIYADSVDSDTLTFSE